MSIEKKDLATIFDVVRWDDHLSVGNIGRYTGEHNRWIKLFQFDLEALLEASDNEVCVPAFSVLSALFACEYIRDSFLSLDVHALKSSRNSVAIPPPGWVSSSEPIVDPSETPFACQFCECNGFQTQLALTMHVVRAHGRKKPGPGTYVCQHLYCV